MADLSVHLIARGVEAAARWYVEVLDATETSRIALPDGRVLTVELEVAGVVVALADEAPDAGLQSPLSLGGTYGALHLVVDDVDDVWRRALEHDAVAFQDVHDAFWGDRTGQFIDPFGHRWAINQHIRDVPHDEVVRLAGEAYSEGGQ